jgi:hypothetical protein
MPENRTELPLEFKELDRAYSEESYRVVAALVGAMFAHLTELRAFATNIEDFHDRNTIAEVANRIRDELITIEMHTRTSVVRRFLTARQLARLAARDASSSKEDRLYLGKKTFTEAAAYYGISEKLVKRAKEEYASPGTSARAGVVYVIADDTKPELYKIGRTYLLNYRLYQLKKQTTGNLTLLASIPTENAVTLEYELHVRYEKYREEGEWFRLSDDALAELIALDDRNYSWRLPNAWRYAEHTR